MHWKKALTHNAVKDLSKAEPITFLLPISDNEYILELASAVKNAAQKSGYNLKVLDSKNSAELQLKQVESARNNGEKAIIIDIVDPYDAPNIIEAAGDMKVIFISRSPADMSVLNENVIHVSSDQEVAGRFQGEWLAGYFSERKTTDIKYILLKGVPTLPLTAQRTEAALQALADGGINASEAALPIIANFQRDEALLNIFQVLISGVEFDTIISNNDAMALGAIEALENMKMDPSKTPVVGIDATYPAYQAIREGTLAMTVFQNAKEQGSAAIAAITNMLENQPLETGIENYISADNPYVIYIPFEPVTMNYIPANLEYTAPISCPGNRIPL